MARALELSGNPGQGRLHSPCVAHKFKFRGCCSSYRLAPSVVGTNNCSYYRSYCTHSPLSRVHLDLFKQPMVLGFEEGRVLQLPFKSTMPCCAAILHFFSQKWRQMEMSAECGWILTFRNLDDPRVPRRLKCCWWHVPPDSASHKVALSSSYISAPCIARRGA